MSEMSLDEVKALVPRSHRNNINSKFVDMLNGCMNDEPTLAQTFKDNFISYSSVLQNGRYKMVDYLNAVKYVTYKMLGKSNSESWKLTFPDRYKRLIDSNITDISSYASMYNSNKLVTQLVQQTMVPLYILNGNMAQDALNTLHDVMLNTSSDKVRVEACRAILDAVKQPEQTALDISLDIKADSIIDGMRSVINELSSKQLGAIKGGSMTAREIFEAELIDVSSM